MKALNKPWLTKSGKVKASWLKKSVEFSHGLTYPDSDELQGKIGMKALKKMKEEQNKITNENCVQCQREMINSYGNNEWSAPFCSYPDCPNFALLQTGILPTCAKK